MLNFNYMMQALVDYENSAKRKAEIEAAACRNAKKNQRKAAKLEWQII